VISIILRYCLDYIEGSTEGLNFGIALQCEVSTNSTSHGGWAIMHTYQVCIEPLDHSHLGAIVCEDARDLNFVARDVIHSEIFSTYSKD
jgi:hypothetical protein